MWLIAAMVALFVLPWSAGVMSSVLPFFTPDPLGCLFLVVFAILGCCSERWIRPGGRLPLACASACLVAFASDTAALMVTGCLALILAFPERQKASAGCLRTLLFAAACAPGSASGVEWMAIAAALACTAGAGRRQPDFAVAPMLEAGCGLLLLCRVLLRPDSVITPVMTATLIVGGMMLAFGRVLSTLTTRKGSIATVGLAGLPAALSISSLGLLLLAGASGSALTAHVAASALVLGLVILWPVSIAFLRTGGLIAEGAGSDQLGRLGGLILFAPRLAGLFAATLLILTFLPPASGFTILWLLVETALGLLPDGFAAALPSLAFLLALGVLVALTGLAALRLAALLLLGSARSPRMAACPDAVWPTLLPVSGSVLFAVVAGLVPGGVLRLAEPVLHQLTGEARPTPQPFFTLVAPDGLSSWMPVGVTALLLLIVLIIRLAQQETLRSRGRAPTLKREILPDIHTGETTPWLGGLTARAPWLPFGEPLIWSGVDMVPSALRAVLFPQGRRRIMSRSLILRSGARCLHRLRRMLLKTAPFADHATAVVLVLAALGVSLSALTP
jgi:formate hydrogenlyase subunit 3/multisubunit Na+/H+ antiporter MnhD subunit